jgi:transposase
MPTTPTIKQLHSLATLKRKWEKAQSHTEKVRWHGLYLLKQGIPADIILQTLDRKESWLMKIVQLFNAHGSQGVTDLRCTNGGHNKLLTQSQEQELHDIIAHTAPPDGGLWSGPKITTWIRKKTGKPVSLPRGWKYLQRLGMNLLRARPVHALAATPREQAAFKKN